MYSYFGDTTLAAWFYGHCQISLERWFIDMGRARHATGSCALLRPSPVRLAEGGIGNCWKAQRPRVRSALLTIIGWEKPESQSSRRRGRKEPSPGALLSGHERHWIYARNHQADWADGSVMSANFRVREFPQKLSYALVKVEGKKRVSEGRFAGSAGELNPFTHIKCSWWACCW